MESAAASGLPEEEARSIIRSVPPRPRHRLKGRIAPPMTGGRSGKAGPSCSGPGAATKLAGGLTMVMFVVSLGGIMGGAVQEEGGGAAGAVEDEAWNSSSVVADASVAKDDYVKVAEDIAKDDSHGYDYGSYGPTDFDCSGPSGMRCTSPATRSGTPGSTPRARAPRLGGAGSKRYDFSKDRLRRGDILVSASHTEISVGDGKVVTADNNERGEAHGGAP